MRLDQSKIGSADKCDHRYNKPTWAKVSVNTLILLLARFTVLKLDHLANVSLGLVNVYVSCIWLF